MPYTIPVVQFPDGSYLMDSKSIASRLEREHPSPSLHLDSPLLPKVEELVSRCVNPARGMWMPLVPEKLLPERSSEYFHRTREGRLGMPLAEFGAKMGGEAGF